MKIAIHIERLTLEGLPLTAAQGPRLRRAVERELARLLTGGGIAAPLVSGGAQPRLAAPPLRFATAMRPDALGRRIAHSVYAGIGRSP